MQTFKKITACCSALFVSIGLTFTAPSFARSDMEAKEFLAKHRASEIDNEQDHSAHKNHADQSQIFRGVFYGLLPCSNCLGIKATLSLKQKSNYLLVTQPAKDSAREYYEKGKYTWDEATKMLTLTPKKGGIDTRYFHIDNESTLTLVNADGSKMMNEDPERLTLRRSDMANTREVHIH
jgi:hypothetical protein